MVQTHGSKDVFRVGDSTVWYVDSLVGDVEVACLLLDGEGWIVVIELFVHHANYPHIIPYRQRVSPILFIFKNLTKKNTHLEFLDPNAQRGAIVHAKALRHQPTPRNSRG